MRTADSGSAWDSITTNAPNTIPRRAGLTVVRILMKIDYNGYNKGNGQTNHLPNQKKITMAKVEIASWSELSLMESLLDEFLTKNGKKHSKYYTAKDLYQRVRTALSQDAEEK